MMIMVMMERGDMIITMMIMMMVDRVIMVT